MAKDKGRIERLSEKLNSRTRYSPPEDTREPIPPTEEEVKSSWDGPQIDDLISGQEKQETHPLMKKLFTVSLIFAVCAVGAAALIYFNGDNFISTKNLDVTVDAPVNIAAGSDVELSITILNKNNAAIEGVNVAINYPDGTVDANNPSKTLTHEKETIDTLGPGEKKTFTQKANFFGTEGEVKTVQISVNYKVAGSNATFTKDKSFDLTIGSAPVTIKLNRPEVVNSGETFTLTFGITSNSTETLHNIVFKTEYPYGWSTGQVTPSAADSAQTIWLLGDLAPGKTKVVKLVGSLNADNNDERTLRYQVGIGSVKGVDTILATDSAVMGISRPALDLSIKLNSENTTEYVAPSGQPIQVALVYKNNMPSNLLNPVITVNISGNALDRSSISTYGGGFYNSTNNTIVWDKSNAQSLDSLKPGDSGILNFSFSTLKNLPISASNPSVNLTITLSGRDQDSNTDKQISETRTVKVASAVVLNSESLYSKGPYANTGSIPPKAEKETTYTIHMTLSNTQNEVLNGAVTATLGPNVKWLGSEDDSISYKDVNNSIYWEVGTLDSGTGFTAPAREVYFRVSITPSLGQVGGIPVLLSSVLFDGVDTFTKNPIDISNPAVTTKISSDPIYVQGDETVVK